MQKACFLLLFLSMFALNVCAKSIVFTLSNGSLVYYLVGSTNGPVMKFVDGKCVVNTDLYEFSQIKNFYVSETDDSSAMNAVKTHDDFSWRDNVLFVKSDASAVQVFQASGAQCDAAISADGGLVTVNLSACPKGVYIVKVAGSSFKVIKK